MTFRPATVSDAAALAALMTELGYPSSPEEMRERLEALEGSADYHALVAEVNGTIAGMVGMTIGRYYEKNGTYGRVVALVVSEAFRGSGIGRALLAEGESWLRAKGVRAIYINSGSHREATHRFYVRSGYSPTGLRFAKELDAEG